MALRAEQRRPSEQLNLDDVVDATRGQERFHRARKSNRRREEDVNGIAERLRFDSRHTLNSATTISRW